MGPDTDISDPERPRRGPERHGQVDSCVEVTNARQLYAAFSVHSRLISAHLNWVGAGLELDSSKYDIIVTRAQLVARYKFGKNVEGWSVGFAISF